MTHLICDGFRLSVIGVGRKLRRLAGKRRPKPCLNKHVLNRWTRRNTSSLYRLREKGLNLRGYSGMSIITCNGYYNGYRALPDRQGLYKNICSCWPLEIGEYCDIFRRASNLYWCNTDTLNWRPGVWDGWIISWPYRFTQKERRSRGYLNSPSEKVHIHTDS